VRPEAEPQKDKFEAESAEGRLVELRAEIDVLIGLTRQEQEGLRSLL